LPAWTESRLNERYVPALRLAEIILRNMSAEAGLGRHVVASFVVNMATVFEDFVTTALREALDSYRGETHAQYEAYMDQAEVSYSKNDRVRFILLLAYPPSFSTPSTKRLLLRDLTRMRITIRCLHTARP
jgi:5-methylcytosine-specific restriction endonuclease McrBC regulatory subunit McrC